jgi:hypothetical protein
MDRPSNAGRPAPAHLKLWRTLKLNELWKALTAVPDAPRGTAQKKMRWRRAEQLAAEKLGRTRRNRAKKQMTKRMQRQRRLKGRNHRTG